MTSPDPTADRTRRHLTHVARGGGIGLLGAGVSAVAGFALVVVVTNGFDAETAGLFFTATSAFLILSATATLGTETGLSRFLLRYEAEGRHGDILPTVRSAVRVTVGLATVLAVVLLVWAEPLAGLIGLDGDGAVTSLRVLALLLPFATWNAVTLAGTRAFGRMRTTVLVDKVARPGVQPVLAVLVSLGGIGLVGLTVAWAVPYAVAAIVSAVLLRRFLHRRGTVQHTEPTTTIRRLRREFWTFTWPRSISRISQMAIQRLDIVLVAALRSPTEAAIYTAATRFVALGQFGVQAIQQVLQPKFTALLAAREEASLRDVYQVSTAWSMAVAWPLYVGVGAVPLVYLSVFGSTYAEEGATVVLLMAGAMMFGIATGPADTLLLMSGRSGLSLFNSLVALALDVVLCLVLIPEMGITGAAVAWAVAVVTRSLLAVLQARFFLGMFSFGRAAAVVLLANVLCLGVPLLVLGRLAGQTWGVVLLTLAAAVPAYALVLWLGRRPLMLTALRGLLQRGRGRDLEDWRAGE